MGTRMDRPPVFLDSLSLWSSHRQFSKSVGFFPKLEYQPSRFSFGVPHQSLRKLKADHDKLLGYYGAKCVF